MRTKRVLMEPRFHRASSSRGRDTSCPSLQCTQSGGRVDCVASHQCAPKSTRPPDLTTSRSGGCAGSGPRSCTIASRRLPEVARALTLELLWRALERAEEAWAVNRVL